MQPKINASLHYIAAQVVDIGRGRVHDGILDENKQSLKSGNVVSQDLLDVPAGMVEELESNLVGSCLLCACRGRQRDRHDKADYEGLIGFSFAVCAIRRHRKDRCMLRSEFGLMKDGIRGHTASDIILQQEIGDVAGN